MTNFHYKKPQGGACPRLAGETPNLAGQVRFLPPPPPEKGGLGSLGNVGKLLFVAKCLISLVGQIAVFKVAQNKTPKSPMPTWIIQGRQKPWAIYSFSACPRQVIEIVESAVGKRRLGNFPIRGEARAQIARPKLCA